MPARRDAVEPPEGFRTAVASLRSARARPEVQLEDAPAPTRIAPFAAALTAEVVVDDDELASGRLVLLHDPDGQDPWQGTMRVVTFVRAGVEADIAADSLVFELDTHEVAYTAAGGTVTRVTSERFGALDGCPVESEIEVRASWTPLDHDLAKHVHAWLDLLSTAAGLLPEASGVVPLPRRAGRRS